jgi:hypothetical protein
LRQHRELLVAGAWSSVLLACVQFDMGDHQAAEDTRDAAFQLGTEAEHQEIMAWSFELLAWFALVGGRYEEVIDHARTGLVLAPNTSAGVQLAVQEAKGWARLGNRQEAEQAMREGATALARLPVPSHPEHHFVSDASKLSFYAATIYAWLGEAERAVEHEPKSSPNASPWPTRSAGPFAWPRPASTSSSRRPSATSSTRRATSARSRSLRSAGQGREHHRPHRRTGPGPDPPISGCIRGPQLPRALSCCQGELRAGSRVLSKTSLIRLGALAVLWGSGFLLIKIALEGMSPIQIVLGRLVAAAVVMAVVVAYRKERLPRRLVPWAHLAVMAVVTNIAPYFLFAWASSTSPPASPASSTPPRPSSRSCWRSAPTPSASPLPASPV